MFFRAHTGILEAPIPALGAAAALGTLWDLQVALWAIVGLLYHYAGYGQNSYYDWEKGYDKDDPHKQHHPLNTGEIDPDNAKVAANGLVAATVVLIVSLAGLNLLAISLIVVAFASGVIYNVYGKSIEHKYIFLAIAHSMLFLIAYATYADTVTPYALLIFLALVVHHSFQIAISGDLKDIEQDEGSVLEEFGIEWRTTDTVSGVSDIGIDNGFIRHTTKVDFRITLLTLTQVGLTALALWILHMDNPVTTRTMTVLFSLGIALWLSSLRVVTDGPYIRKRRMRNIAVRELVGLWTIYAALIPVIGELGYIIAFVLCVSYLITHSRFMWGTFLRPKV